MANKIIAILGTSGAGKTSIVDYLGKHGYKRIKSVTTRPPRSHSEKEYVYMDDDQFKAIKDTLTVVRAYKGALITGTPKDYFYGFRKEELDRGGVIVIDPLGFQELIEQGFDVVGVYLYRSYGTRLIGAEKRPRFNRQEFDRREQADAHMFAWENLNKLGKMVPLYIVDNDDKPLYETERRVLDIANKVYQ